MIFLGLLFLYLPACAASAIIPLTYATTAIGGAEGAAMVGMGAHAMSRSEDMRRQAQENMQSQNARDEQRLAMERERHEAWRKEQQIKYSQVLINPDTGETVFGSEIAQNGKIESYKQKGFVEIKNLPSVGIKLPKYNNAENGIIIEGVYPDSPAAKVGLKDGDKIVEKNGKPVKTLAGLEAQRRPKMGDNVEYKIIRGGKEMVFSMKTVPFVDILEAK